MAEDKPASGRASGSSGARSAANAKKSGAAGSDTDTRRATDKPVLSKAQPRTSQYLVTVDNRTGIALKIEKFNEQTSEKTELTTAEYALIYPYGGPRPGTTSTAPGTMSSPSHATSGTTTNPSDTTALSDAYYRGVADYFKALSGS